MIGGLKPLDDDRKSIYLPSEEVLRLLRERGSRAPAVVPPVVHHGLGELIATPQPTGAGFCLSEDNDFYHLNNVMFNGGLCVVSWTKKQLEDGAQHDQQQWIERTRTTREKIASAPLYDSCVEHLFRYKDVSGKAQKDLLERVKEMFKHDFNPNNTRAVTSSRIFYKVRCKGRKVEDVVKHNLGYTNEEPISAGLQGIDGFINASCGFEGFLESVLKTRDCAGVEQRYEWLSGLKAYLWRLNNVTQDEERAVVLGRYDYSSRFGVSCDDYVIGSRPARGVVVNAAQKIFPVEMKVNS